jgi:hypothetical protein
LGETVDRSVEIDQLLFKSIRDGMIVIALDSSSPATPRSSRSPRRAGTTGAIGRFHFAAELLNFGLQCGHRGGGVAVDFVDGIADAVDDAGGGGPQLAQFRNQVRKLFGAFRQIAQLTRVHANLKPYLGSANAHAVPSDLNPYTLTRNCSLT